MSENSPPSAWQQTELPWMSLPADSPAKTSALPESRRVSLTARAAAYGQKSPDLLATYDRGSSSWRTSQICLVARLSGLEHGLAEFSETWPRSGTMLNGTAYQHQPLAPLTNGTVYGLLPTPTAKGRGSNTTERAHGLTAKARYLMWPTLRATDGPKGARTPSAATLKRVQTGMANLSEAVLHVPTPTARDWKDNGKSPSELARNSTTLATIAGGALNPPWVEWLMGFPIGWTDLEA